MPCAFERERDALEAELGAAVLAGGAVGDAGEKAVRAGFPHATLAADGSLDGAPELEAKQLMEHCLCRVLDRLRGEAVDAGAPVMEHAGGVVPRLLDLTLWMCEKGLCDGGVIFTVLEQLVEGATIRECKSVFSYVEDKTEVLRGDTLWKRGRLIMLRTCNELLRRLSKTQDTELCGRVLVLLTHLFPLAERSALNVSGLVNKANLTAFASAEDAQKQLEAEGLAGSDNGGVDAAFYCTFWGLSVFLQAPVAALQAPAWSKLVAGVETVLTVFEAQPLSKASGDTATGVVDVAMAKYLTSPKLLGLQLRDPTFRRSFLVQCAILIANARGPPGPTKPLEKEQTSQLDKLWTRVKAQIKATPPDGAQFLATVEHVLVRERNWAMWKRDQCKDFAQPPADRDAPRAGPKRRPKLAAGTAAKTRLGNAALDRLWGLTPTNEAALSSTAEGKGAVPELKEYLEPVMDDLDPEAGIEDEYKRKNDKPWCWRAYRLLARNDFRGLATAANTGLESAVPGILGVPNPAEQAAAAEETAAADEKQDVEMAEPAEATDEPEAAGTKRKRDDEEQDEEDEAGEADAAD